MAALADAAFYGSAAVFLCVVALAGSKAGRLLGGWAFETWHWVRRRLGEASVEITASGRATEPWPSPGPHDDLVFAIDGSGGSRAGSHALTP